MNKDTKDFFENTITTSQATRFIKHHFDAERKTGKRSTPMLWGKPGQGKSSIVEQFHQDISDEWDLFTFLLNQNDPVDLKGIPLEITRGKHKYTSNAAPDMIPILNEPDSAEGRKVIIFLDEIAQCTPAMMALGANICDGIVGAKRVDYSRTFMVAASNRLGDRAATYPMPTNVTNRMCHVNVECTFNDWSVWAVSVGIDANILAYIDRDHESLNEEVGKNRAYCTPRSWEKLSNSLSMLGKDWWLDPVNKAIVHGWIGEKKGVDFISFTRAYKEKAYLDQIKKGNMIPVPPLQELMTLAWESACWVNSLIKEGVQRNIKHTDSKLWIDFLGNSVNELNNLYIWFSGNKVDIAAGVLFGKYQTNLTKDNFRLTMLTEKALEPAAKAFNKFHAASKDD